MIKEHTQFGLLRGFAILSVMVTVSVTANRTAMDVFICRARIVVVYR